MAFTKVIYQADNGTSYVMRIDSRLWAQDNGATPAVKLIGGAAYTGSPRLGAVPKTVKRRHVTVKGNTSGRKRSVVCLSADAPLYTGTSTEVSLGTEHSAATEVFTVQSPEGEHNIAQ